MPKTYYKVVRNCPESHILTSVWVSNFPFSLVINDKPLTVEYKLGQFVSPNVPYTKLMIFDTLENAENFKGNFFHYGNVEIYSVYAKGVSKTGLFIEVTSSNIITLKEEIGNLIKSRKNKKKYINKEPFGIPPKGTLFAKEVKLINKIIC